MRRRVIMAKKRIAMMSTLIRMKPRSRSVRARLNDLINGQLPFVIPGVETNGHRTVRHLIAVDLELGSAPCYPLGRQIADVVGKSATLARNVEVPHDSLRETGREHRLD